MELVFTLLQYIVLGFFGLLAILIVVALLFGKRIVKQWDLEAEFRDARGREFGEFEIELSRIAKEETVDTFKASFHMRHASLEAGQRVEVFVDETLVLAGEVGTAGRIYLGDKDIVTALDTASAGQVCRVVYGGVERFTEVLVPD